MKKFLSFLLAISMILSYVPVPAMAEEPAAAETGEVLLAETSEPETTAEPADPVPPESTEAETTEAPEVPSETTVPETEGTAPGKEETVPMQETDPTLEETTAAAEETIPDTLVTDWSWVDPEGLILENSLTLMAMPASFEELCALLPRAILTQGQEVKIASWSCRELENEMTQGSYLLTAELAAGWVSETSITLQVNLESGAAMMAAVSDDVPVTAEYFPDPVFLEFVKHVDSDHNGVLSLQERESVLELEMRGGRPGPAGTGMLKDLTGISYFPGIQNINVESNQLQELDLSSLAQLQEVECSDNQLTSIKVHPNLQKLFCDNNRLQTLDVSQVTGLMKLSCINNQIRELTFTSKKLLRVDCANNQLTELDVSGNGAMYRVRCNGNRLTGLNVAGCTALEELNCADNQLTGLDLSTNHGLTILDCSRNQLVGLTVDLQDPLDPWAEPSLFLCEGNSRTVPAHGNTFDLKALEKDGFQLSRTRDWRGGRVAADGILTVTGFPATVTYGYDAGERKPLTAEFRLVVENTDYSYIEAVPAKCETAGMKGHYQHVDGGLYIAKNGIMEPVQESELQIPALGHDWRVKYTWNQDHTSCTAEHVCSRDSAHNERETAVASEVITRQPGCEIPGLANRKAEFTSAWAKPQSFANAEFPALGHDWQTEYTWAEDGSTCTASAVCRRDSSHVKEETVEAVAVITKAPTCLKTGLQDCTATFTDNWAEVQIKKDVEVPALGHDWQVEYTWNRDHTRCTATHICSRDSAHNEREMAEASDVITRQPGCETTGLADRKVQFSSDWAVPQTFPGVEVPALGHDWQTEYTWAEDGSTCTASAVCRRNGSHLKEETIESVAVVTKEPTCLETGLQDCTAAFTANWAEVQIKKDAEIPALGHDWQVTEYTWSEDGHHCTAYRVCSRDPLHREEETVESVGEITLLPNHNVMGETTYTVTFTAPWAESQTKILADIPALHQPGWSIEGDKQRFYYDDGTYAAETFEEIEGSRYYFDKDGYMYQGWADIDGERYYFGTDGKMQMGWIQVGENRYYMDENGAMVRDRWIPTEEEGLYKEHYVNKDGIWLEDARNAQWVKVGSKYQYYLEDGSFVSNDWQCVDGAWYHFDENGFRQSGWLDLEDGRYYLDRYGVMLTGYQKIGSRYYFLDEEGRMQVGFQNVDGVAMCFKPTGEKITSGWAEVDGFRYYLDKNCNRAVGLTKIGSRQYYFDGEGRMQTGFQQVDEVRRCFAPTGELLINKWYEEENGKYYMDRYGSPMIGLQKIGSRQYYFDQEGRMQTGFQQVNGVRRCFAPTGELLINKWYEEESGKYYIDRYGSPLIGLRKIGSRQYYFDEEGRMQVGFQQVDGVRRCFAPTGELLLNKWYEEESGKYYMDRYGSPMIGLQKIGSRQYYFDEEGRMQVGFQQVDGILRCFAPTGELLINKWYEEENGRYYIDRYGSPLVGYQKVGSKYYLFNEAGVMQTGRQEVNGSVKFFGPDGAMLSYGWVELEGGRYYLQKDGSFASGYAKISGKQYFFSPEGIMQTGWQEVNGERKLFGLDGIQVLYGWVNLAEGRCYLQKDGSFMVGLQKIGSRQYFFDGAGYLQHGFRDLEDGRHYFNTPNGDMVYNKWLTIDGEKYYFDRYGVLQIGLFKVGSRQYCSDAEGRLQHGFRDLEDGRHYFNSPNGDMVYNKWLTIDGEKYYFDRYGVLQTGLFKVGSRQYFSSETGAMQLGMQEIQGRKHYFNSPNGDMAINKWIAAGDGKYYMDRYGNPMAGLQKIGSRQYFFSPEGKMQTGFQKVTGRRLCFRPVTGELVLNSWVQVGPYRYYMDRYGDPLTGAQRLSGKQYLFNSIGVLQTGWQMLNREKKYFRPVTGELVLNSWADIGAYRYYMDRYGEPTRGLKKIGRYSYSFDSQGRMQEGWQTVNSERRYFRPITGQMVTSDWADVGGNRYYMDSRGNYVTGCRRIGRYSYLFDEAGQMQTGWQTVKGRKLFFSHSTGAMALSGWIQDGNVRYYLDKRGNCYTGLKVITGKTYLFDEAGRMQTGWQNVDGEQRCFSPATGELLFDGWVDTDGYRYYLNGEGGYTVGLQKIGTAAYLFDSEGRMQTGVRKYQGSIYCFAEDGQMRTGWAESAGSRYYLHEDGKAAVGLEKIGTATYLFNVDGRMQTGLQKYQGSIYCFTEDGEMRTGWAESAGSRYYLHEDGRAAVGLEKIGAATYLFNVDGQMQTGLQKYQEDLYFLGTDGCMQTGWKLIGGGQYYLKPDGRAAVGLEKIGAATYLFNADGQMQTGLQKYQEDLYFLGTDGCMQTGWKTIDGGKYYLKPDGRAAVGIEQIDGAAYLFNVDGRMQTGLQKYQENLYYLGTDGKMQTGWKKIGGNKYYLKPDGRAAVGVEQIDGAAYLFNEDGHMQTGLQKYQGNLYYLETDGKMQTGWKKIGGNKYYLKPDGRAAVGIEEIEGADYLFNAEGHMQVGFQTYQGNLYYLENDGRMLKNSWLTLKKHKYYLQANGAAAIGDQVIAGERYYFNADGSCHCGWLDLGPIRRYYDKEGRMQTGWKLIQQETYYFDPEGTLLTGWNTVDGHTYYFGENGAMVRDSWVGDRYVDQNGIWDQELVKGSPRLIEWLKANGKYDWLRDAYIYASEWQEDGGNISAEIAYEMKTGKIQFHYQILKNGRDTSGDMSYDPDKQQIDTGFRFSICPQKGDIVPYMTAGNEMDNRTYSYSQDLKFYSQQEELSQEAVDNLGNEFLRHAIMDWEKILTSAGLTLQDLGFINLGTVQPVPHVHVWREADCRMPKACVGCRLVNSPPLEHNYVNGACSRCTAQESRPVRPEVKKVLNYIHDNGKYIHENRQYIYNLTEQLDGVNVATIAEYYPDVEKIVFAHERKFGQGSIRATFDYDASKKCSLGAITVQYVPNPGAGIPAYTVSVPFDIASYTGNANYEFKNGSEAGSTEINAQANVMMKETIASWNRLCGKAQASLADLGFTSYSKTDETGPVHMWGEATCTEAKKCIICGKSSGSPLGHNYVSGVCTRCGKKEEGYIPGSVKRLITYIQGHGNYNAGKYTVSYRQKTDHGYGHYGMTYDPAKHEIACIDISEFPGIGKEFTTLLKYDIFTQQSTGPVIVEYKYRNETSYLVGADIDIRTYTKETRLVFDQGSYGPNNHTWVEDTANASVYEGVAGWNVICEMANTTIQEIGFSYYR